MSKDYVPTWNKLRGNVVDGWNSKSCILIGLESRSPAYEEGGDENDSTIPRLAIMEVGQT